MRVQTRYEQAAEEFARRLTKTTPEVEAVVLYGSVMRGDAHDDSDIDLLVLTEAEPKELRERAWALAGAIGDGMGTFLQVGVENVAEFRRCADLGYPWQITIARQGRPLFDRGAFASIHAALPPRVREEPGQYRPSSETLDDLLRSAEQALAAAKLLLEEGYWNDASSRAYYAMFGAASAAVHKAGIEEVRSHRALVKLFGQHIVRSKGIEALYLKDLQEAFQLRLDADYKLGFRVDETEAREATSKAEQFVARMRAFVAES